MVRLTRPRCENRTQSLPGNWFIVGLAALFASALETGDAAQGLNWHGVALLGVIAAGGEVIEFFAGAAGAANKGASRRAIALAVVGTIAGSITGAVMGLPIPLIGPLIKGLLVRLVKKNCEQMLEGLRARVSERTEGLESG